MENKKDANLTQIPKNDQVKAELDAAQDYLKQHQPNTAKQEQFIQKAQKLIDVAKETIDEKNPGNNFQLLINDLQLLANALYDPNVAEDVKKDLEDFVNSLRSFTMSFFGSSDFRNVLSQSLNMLKMIFEREDLNQMIRSPLKNLPSNSSQILSIRWEDIPNEQRQKIKENFKNFLKELTEQDEISSSFRNLMNLASHLNDEFYKRFNDPSLQRNVQNIGQHTKQLVEGFTRGDHLDRFLEHLKGFGSIIRDDSRLKDWLKELRDHIEGSLENPEVISTEEFVQRSENLIKGGIDLSNKYAEKGIFHQIIDESQNLLKDVKNDQTIQRVRDRIEEFVNYFRKSDARGKTTIDWDVLSDIRSLILEFLIQRIKEVQVPKFEISDPDYDYLTIGDLQVSLASIVPEHIKIQSHSNLDFSVRDLKTETAHAQINVKIEGIKPAIKDFYFSFKRKGVVPLQDEGHADLFVSGAGMLIDMNFDVIIESNKLSLVSKNVVVKVDDLKIDVKDAKHKTLLNVLTTMFSGTIERQVERAVEQRLELLGRDLANAINERALSKISMRDLQEKVKEGVVSVYSSSIPKSKL